MSTTKDNENQITVWQTKNLYAVRAKCAVCMVCVCGNGGNSGEMHASRKLTDVVAVLAQSARNL